MPRIVGVDIPSDKQIHVSLTYIYGIGNHRAKEILNKAGINPTVRTKNLSDDELSRINSIVETSFETEGQLRRSIAQNVARLRDIGCWRGFRHRKGLPVRGQRTKTNARTRKGPRKVVATKKSIKALT
jgi:small subunit ribosomal protein S13